MALKDLLVGIDPTTAADARLKLAFNLARANRAHLTGAYSLPRWSWVVVARPVSGLPRPPA